MEFLQSPVVVIAILIVGAIGFALQVVQFLNLRNVKVKRMMSPRQRRFSEVEHLKEELSDTERMLKLAQNQKEHYRKALHLLHDAVLLNADDNKRRTANELRDISIKFYTMEQTSAHDTEVEYEYKSIRLSESIKDLATVIEEQIQEQAEAQQKQNTSVDIVDLLKTLYGEFYKQKRNNAKEHGANNE